MIARVINLDPNGERWDGFTASALAAGVQFTRFPAVDTRAITPDKVGIFVFVIASILKDGVNRIGDLLDDGKENSSFKA